MRLQIFDVMDENVRAGDIVIDESQGWPDVIISSLMGQELLDWENT